MKDTNPDHYKVGNADFIKFMDDPQIKGFGDWMFANGFNMGELFASTLKERISDGQTPVLVYAPSHNVDMKPAINYLSCKKCNGNRHRLIRYAHSGFRISCPLCGYCTNIKETEDDAIMAWNAR